MENWFVLSHRKTLKPFNDSIKIIICIKNECPNYFLLKYNKLHPNGLKKLAYLECYAFLRCFILRSSFWRFKIIFIIIKVYYTWFVSLSPLQLIGFKVDFYICYLGLFLKSNSTITEYLRFIYIKHLIY